MLEFHVAGGAFEDVDTFARPQVRVDVPEMLGRFSAPSALDLRRSGIEEILIQIHQHLAAFWIRTGHGLQTVVTDGSSIASRLSPLLVHSCDTSFWLMFGFQTMTL